MNIIGCTFLGADYSFFPMPSNVENITKLCVCNAQFDTLYVTADTQFEETMDVNAAWNWDTIMYASYDKNLSAGNVDYTLNNISDLLIKRREKGTWQWVTIYHKKINSIEDLTLTFIDWFFRNNVTLEYACVAVLNGAESNYSVKEIDSSFQGMFLCDKTNIYGTSLDVGSCDTSRVHYTIKNEPLHQKYPSSYSTAAQSYDTGTASGYFVKINPETNDFDVNNSLDYRKSLIDFLTDNKPKLLRHEDGRIWLINVDGDVSDTMDGHYLHRMIEFSWYESGDYNSEKDLYDSDLSDVPSEFWSGT